MYNEYIEFLFKLSAIAVAVTTITKFVVAIWKKGIVQPQTKAMSNIASEMMNPFMEKLDQVLDFMADSKLDRSSLNERYQIHEERLDKNHDELHNHETRITVLEEGKKYYESKLKGDGK